MLLARAAIALSLLALWLYCIIDVITTDKSLVRNLPKPLWVFIVVVLPTVGSIMWLIAGRPPRSSFGTGDPRPRPARGPLGVEDRPDFGVREADLKRREEERHRREEELGGPPPPAPDEPPTEPGGSEPDG